MSFEKFDWPGSKLTEPEVFWRDHQRWLEERGYMLRPRYRPDWKPSWLQRPGSDMIPTLCEDGRSNFVRFLKTLHTRLLKLVSSRTLTQYAMRHASLMRQPMSFSNSFIQASTRTKSISPHSCHRNLLLQTRKTTACLYTKYLRYLTTMIAF
jgi:hypothetical protein